MKFIVILQKISNAMKPKLLFILCFLTLTAFTQNTHILPTPQHVDFHSGTFHWDDKVVLTYDASDAEISQIVNMFRHDLEQINPQIQFSRSVIKGKHFIELVKTDHLKVEENEDQAYQLTINGSYIRMEASSATGLFYATQSLKQLYRHAVLEGKESEIALPCMTITDWPNLKIRAWQDDISRGPIVSMEYLKSLIPQMAECKLNAFSLYTEHTFKTKCHPDIAPADAFTAEEIKELEEFCRPYHIQIIGNQQCFGHFEEILRNPFYSDLADTKWNLNPANENTYRFLEKHLKEVAKAYKSPYFNINCDETESLGQGYAKAYVDSVGAETAYYTHVNRVNRMLRPYRKRVMIWGDIADAHPEILENLDKDIFLIAWSYVGKDDFNDFLKPYANSGRKFFVAPGVSLSERVWPKHHEFVQNITYLCRDGYRNGALGVINTCWDDFGESLINNALYGLALGAEMSWNPLKKTDAKNAAIEASMRETETNFSIHFFACTSTDPLHDLHTLSQLTQYDEIGKFSALTKKATDFYPSLVGDSVLKTNEKAIKDLIALEQRLESDKKKNASVIDNALYAVHRMKWCAERNVLRCKLHETFNNPTEENIKDSQNTIKELVAALHNMKNEYIKGWNIESRHYWLDVNTKQYDDLAIELQQIEYLPFIEPAILSNGNPSVALRTIFGNKEIHYTTDLPRQGGLFQRTWRSRLRRALFSLPQGFRTTEAAEQPCRQLPPRVFGWWQRRPPRRHPRQRRLQGRPLARLLRHRCRHRNRPWEMEQSNRDKHRVHGQCARLDLASQHGGSVWLARRQDLHAARYLPRHHRDNPKRQLLLPPTFCSRPLNTALAHRGEKPRPHPRRLPRGRLRFMDFHGRDCG